MQIPVKKTVLVVDDTPENLIVLGGVLQPKYRVRVANSGKRALQVAASEPRPDMILLDVMMPEMDGYAVLAQLRGNPLTRNIPVIFVTAMDADADEQHGLALGAVDYIAKPVRPAIVLARVNAHMELKLARDVLQDQNAWLEAEVARRMRHNQIMQDVSIRALACLAEVRDLETGQHIRRTQAYVEVLVSHLRGHPRFAAFLSDRIARMICQAAAASISTRTSSPPLWPTWNPSKKSASAMRIATKRWRRNLPSCMRAARHEVLCMRSIS